MKITNIVVSAGRVIPHPTVAYSNLRPQLTLTATLDESDDIEVVSKELQAKAEKLVEDHKNHLLETIDAVERMADEEASNLEEQIQKAQKRLQELRSKPSRPRRASRIPAARTIAANQLTDDDIPF